MACYDSPLMHYTYVSQFRRVSIASLSYFSGYCVVLLSPGWHFRCHSKIIYTLTRERGERLTSLSYVQMAPIKLHIRARCCVVCACSAALVLSNMYFASIPLRRVRSHLVMYSHVIMQMSSKWYICVDMVECSHMCR